MAILEGMAADPSAVAAATERISGDPSAAAVLCDLDGTLAPIVDRAEEATVPGEVRELLASIASTYALTAVVSGRRAADARRIVGLDELTYSGNHGYEILRPGESEASPDPSLNGRERDAPDFVAGLDAGELAEAGIRIEDKGAIVALHWRGAENEGKAESLASEIEAEIEWQELDYHRGRKVLEIRPNVAINKGIAVAALIPTAPVSAALYGGDDRTDADAFTALRTLVEDGELADAVAVGVDSDEAPPEVTGAADIVVDGTEGFAGVLRALAGR